MPAISDVNDLQNINNDLAGTYWLTKDIDASATMGWNGGAGFIPLGDAGTYFTGIFNTRGHTISDLYINRPGTNYIGLFGIASEESEIIYARLLDANITGNNLVGGLGGLINGTVLNCGVTGAITGTGDSVGGLIGSYNGQSLLNSFSTATIVGSSTQVGGLIGITSMGIGGEISKCYSTGIVTATSSYAGGLIGRVYAGIITQCYASGNVASGATGDYVGGLIGYVNSSGDGMAISDCFARGNATGDDRIAGLIGYLATGDIVDNCYSTGVPSGDTDVGGLCSKNFGTITNCFWDTQTSGTAVSDGGTGKTTSQMKTKSTFTSAGWDFIVIWGINGITNDGYPFFWAMPPEPMPESPRRTVLVEDKITLESIRNVEMAAMGKFRVGEDGKAIWKSRYARNP